MKSLENIEVEKIPSLQEQPVQSAIALPAASKPLPVVSLGNKEGGAGYAVRLSGYAYSGGGRGIVRVDVSPDDGQQWHTATLTQGSEQPLDRAWAWTFWEARTSANSFFFFVSFFEE